MRTNEIRDIGRQLATYTEHRSWCEIRTRPKVNGATWKCTCGLHELLIKLEENNEDSNTEPK